MLGVRAMCRNSKPVGGASSLNSKATLLLTSTYEELLAIIGRPSESTVPNWILQKDLLVVGLLRWNPSAADFISRLSFQFVVT